MEEITLELEIEDCSLVLRIHCPKKLCVALMNLVQ
jgi:hypothetical protein